MQCLDDVGLCLCLSSYREVRHCNHEKNVSWSLASVDISFIDLDMKLLRIVMIVMLLIAMRE